MKKVILARRGESIGENRDNVDEVLMFSVFSCVPDEHTREIARLARRSYRS